MIRCGAMQNYATLVALGALLVSGSARADMLGEGEKGVKLSIHVDAQVPAGKLLVLANTFRGVDIVTPGVDQAIEWHPLRGALQLRLVAADLRGKIEVHRERLESEEALGLTKTGAVCGPSFDGVRTISDTLVAEEIRWSFEVAFAGAGCQAKLLRSEYLDGARKVVDPKATLPTAAEMPVAPTPAPVPAPTPAPVPAPAATTPASTPATPAAPPPVASGCTVAGEPGAGALVVLVLAGLGLGRRRRA